VDADEPPLVLVDPFTEVEELTEPVELVLIVELFRGRVPLVLLVPVPFWVELFPPMGVVELLLLVPLPVPTGRVPLVELDELEVELEVELVVLVKGGGTTELPLPAAQRAHELARMTLPNLVLIHSAIDSN